jgi:hypothetical protein
VDQKGIEWLEFFGLVIAAMVAWGMLCTVVHLIAEAVKDELAVRRKMKDEESTDGR